MYSFIRFVSVISEKIRTFQGGYNYKNPSESNPYWLLNYMQQGGYPYTNNQQPVRRKNAAASAINETLFIPTPDEQFLYTELPDDTANYTNAISFYPDDTIKNANKSDPDWLINHMNTLGFPHTFRQPNEEQKNTSYTTNESFYLSVETQNQTNEDSIATCTSVEL